MNEAVNEILANLRSWQGLPKYSIERRIDVWLTPFLAGFLQDQMGGTVELVAAEFPIRKKGQGKNALSVNADFLLRRTGGRSLDGTRDGDGWMFLELKTDGGSIKRSQFDQYFKNTASKVPERWTVADLSEGIENILERTDAMHRAGYRKLLAQLKRARTPGAEVEVYCLSPASIAAPGVTFIGLRKFADWKPQGEDHKELWSLIAPLLRGLARSDKGRRVRPYPAA